jgi:hypothetical protein
MRSSAANTPTRSHDVSKLSDAQQRTLLAISRGAHWGRARDRYDYASSGEAPLKAATVHSLLLRQLVVLASADRYARHGTIELTPAGRSEVKVLSAAPAPA